MIYFLINEIFFLKIVHDTEIKSKSVYFKLKSRYLSKINMNLCF